MTEDIDPSLDRRLDRGLLLRAVRLACARHAGQVKPRQQRPVIDHCLEVAQLVSDAGLDIEVTAAAILHDTLEKTETAAQEIEAEFGSRVRALVEVLTDQLEETEESRKARLKAAPAGAQSIKCADIASNLEALALAHALTLKDINDKAATIAVLNRADPYCCGARNVFWPAPSPPERSRKVICAVGTNRLQCKPDDAADGLKGRAHGEAHGNRAGSAGVVDDHRH